jgi:hypothetical protein
MVWPEDEPGEPREVGFFYLEISEDVQPRSPAVIKKHFTPITVVPVVTPLDRAEEMKNQNYVRAKANTRLASRHFRNHLRHLKTGGDWDGFKSFASPWVPEIELLDVELDMAANRLSAFYLEQDSRVPKELAWAGDGLQIWLQLLWHVYRAQNSPTIVLDEPEVYLHPDLQRRLVRLLEGLEGQVILASHSADVISEARPDEVVWVDRKASQARKTTSHSTLSALSASLGTSFNLALARSMRSRLVVATDCEDLRVIRALAQRVGAANLANEYAVSLIQLTQIGSWNDTDRIGEVIRGMLPPHLPAVLLLGAGQRPDKVNVQLLASLAAPGNTVRIWSRPQIENYLLHAETLARVSGAAPEAITDRMACALASSYEATKASYGSAAVRAAAPGSSAQALGHAEEVFDVLWLSTETRQELVLGTRVIGKLNDWFSSEGYRTVTARELAKAIKPHVLAVEVFDQLLHIDGLVS